MDCLVLCICSLWCRGYHPIRDRYQGDGTKKLYNVESLICVNLLQKQSQFILSLSISICLVSLSFSSSNHPTSPIIHLRSLLLPLQLIILITSYTSTEISIPTTKTTKKQLSLTSAKKQTT